MTKDESDFLQKDFEHWGEAYFRNEEGGERRLSFFIGVVTAALGAIGFLAKKGDVIDVDSVRGLGIGTSLALLLLGQLTLLRIVRRNAATDCYLQALGVIRRHVLPRPLVDAYMKRMPKGRSFWTGGLAYVVAYVNGGLGAIAAWLASGSVVPALGALAALVLVQSVVEIPFLEQRTRRGDGKPAEAFRSGVGLLVSDDQGQVLALERRDAPGAWQLPQGGIETGEEPEAAAWRELREETGLTEDQVTLAGRSPCWIGYELPDQFRSAKTGRGQVHQWFHFRTRAPGAGSSLAGNGESARLTWRALRDVIEEAAAFRRPVYEMLAREFPVRLARESPLREEGP